MPMTEPPHAPRVNMLTFRATRSERQQLDRIANNQGLSLSEVIRLGLVTQGLKPER